MPGREVVTVGGHPYDVASLLVLVEIVVNLDQLRLEVQSILAVTKLFLNIDDTHENL